jgi:hypothetical protein
MPRPSMEVPSMAGVGASAVVISVIFVVRVWLKGLDDVYICCFVKKSV